MINKHYKNTVTIATVSLMFAVLALAINVVATKVNVDMQDLKAEISILKTEKGSLEGSILNLEAENTMLNSIVSNAVTFDEFTVTAYCACGTCTGSGKGITRSGARVEEGVTIAVDPKVIPLGTRVYIDGLGFFTAQDTGGAVKGNHIDVYFKNHNRAEDFGTQTLPVALYWGE